MTGITPTQQCPTHKWPAWGKNGRAWARSKPEPEDEEAGEYAQCFICGKTLWAHGGVWEGKKKNKKWTPHVYCIIPTHSTRPLVDEDRLRSKWARMQNRFYRRLIQNNIDFEIALKKWQER